MMLKSRERKEIASMLSLVPSSIDGDSSISQHAQRQRYIEAISIPSLHSPYFTSIYFESYIVESIVSICVCMDAMASLCICAACTKPHTRCHVILHGSTTTQQCVLLHSSRRNASNIQHRARSLSPFLSRLYTVCFFLVHLIRHNTIQLQRK